MQIIVKDRITGIQTKRSPFGTFGPGNMLDDSSRNAWVSSYVNDQVIVDANSQVDSAFLGRVRADVGTYTFCDNPRTPTLSHTNNTSGNITATLTSHGLVTGDYVNLQSDNYPLLETTKAIVTKVDDNTFTFDSSGAKDSSIYFYGANGIMTLEDHGLSVDSGATQYTCGLVLSDVKLSGEAINYEGSSGIIVTAINANTLQLHLTSTQVDSFDYSFSSKNQLILYASSDTTSTSTTVRKIQTSTTQGIVSQGVSGSTIVHGERNISVRYFDSLSSFVRGIFVQAVNSFVDLPYSSKKSRFILDLKTTVNQNENIITHWFGESYDTSNQTAYNINSVMRNNGTLVLHCVKGSTGIPNGWEENASVVVTGDSSRSVVNGSLTNTMNNLNGHYVIQNVFDTYSSNAQTLQSLGVSTDGGTQGFTVVLKARGNSDTGTSISVGNTGTAPNITAQVTGEGATQIQKTGLNATLVNSASGRFCSEPHTGVTINYDGTLGEATLSFSASHGMVNNDKIIIYGSGVAGLDGSYLITYYSKKEVKIKITKKITSTISSITRNSTTNVTTVAFNTTHGFTIGDEVAITGSTDSGQSSGTSVFNGTINVTTVPNTKSFTFVSTSGTASTGGTATTGVDGQNSTTANVARPINLDDFNKVTVGGFVGTNYQFTNSAYKRHQNNFLQITSIKGDGTSKNNVVLSGGISDNLVLTDLNKVTKIYSIQLPITSGILETGFSISFPNPQTGLSEGRTDYSVKKELPTGSYYFLNRVAGKTYSGNIVGTQSQIEDFMAFAEEFLGKPFAVLVAQDMNLDAKTSIYAYMASMPTMSFQTKTGNLRTASFSFREVL